MQLSALTGRRDHLRCFQCQLRKPGCQTGVRHTTAILAIILVSYFMILLDNSIIFTALPKIHAAMQFSPAVRNRQRRGLSRAPCASQHG